MRLLLATTVVAITIGDLAGAQRALGASDPHGPTAVETAAAPPAGSARPVAVHHRPDATASSTATAGSRPEATAAPTVTRRGAAVSTHPPVTPATPPRPAEPAPAPVPTVVARRGAAIVAPTPTTRGPVTAPVRPQPAAPAPAPQPTAQPAPKPGPQPAPAPSPAPTPASATADPSTSMAPGSEFEQACWTSPPDIQSCNQAALADIDQARASEGLGALALPAGFYDLGAVAQVIAVANAERTSRGLPAMPESSTLDGDAQQGAVQGRDPTGPSNTTWASNYALGDPTALAADFSWMYDDGPGSQNVDCTSTERSGCWGHRHNILSPWAGSAGAGVATYQGRVSLTQLFVKQS